MNGYIEDEGNSNCCNIHPTELVVGICPLCLKERLLILLASYSSTSKHAHQYHHHHHHPRRSRSRRSHHIYVLQKVSALGSFLRRSSDVASRPQQKLDSTGSCNDTTSTSQEDSFISIKFGDDGCASWDKGRDSKPASLVEEAAMNLKLPSSNHNLNKKQLLYSTTSTGVKKKKTSKSSSSSNSSIVEHNITSPRGGTLRSSNSSIVEHNITSPRGGTLRWRKRVGQVLFQFVRLKRSTMDESSCHVSNSGKVKGSLKSKKDWIKTLTKKRDHA